MIKILISMLSLLICMNGFSQWQEINTPRGIKVNGFSTQNDNLYACTSGGIYKYFSNNWSKLGNDFNSNVTGLIENSSYLFTGTSTEGVYRSSDNGNTWLQVNNNLTNTNVREIQMYKSFIFVGTSNGLFSSDNNGIQWTDKSSNLGDKNISTILVFNDSLIIGTQNGIYMSPDTAKSWSAKSSGLTSKNITDIISINNTLFASTLDGGVFLSVDNAKTWSNASDGLNSSRVNSLFHFNDTLFAGTPDSLFYSSNLTTLDWGSMKTNTSIEEVLAIAEKDDVLMVGNSFGTFFKSSDFVENNNGFPSYEIKALTNYNNNIYISTSNGIWQGSNLGKDWIYINNFPDNTFSKIINLNDTTALIYNAKGVYLSYDTLKTWNLSLSQNNISSIAITNDTVFIGTSNNGVQRSTDLCNSWLPVNIGLESSIIVDLKILNNYIFAVCGGFSAINVPNAKKIFRSSNWGDEWQAVDDLKYGYQDIAVFNNCLYRAYANNSSYESLYKSTDYGTTWAEIMDSYGNDFIASPYVFYPTDTILFSFYDNKVNLSYAGNDKIWYRLNAGCNAAIGNELKGVLKMDSILFLWSKFNMWERKISDLIPPAMPTNVIYEVDEENVVKIKWDDNSNDETSFGIRRYWEHADIFVPANTTTIEFDIDTLTQSPGYFSFPFYVFANKSGDYSLFAESNEGSVGINDIDYSPKDVCIYPNPVKEVFYFSINKSLQSDEYKVNIYNYSGQKIISKDFFVNQPINISALKKGIYLGEFINKAGEKTFSKIIKE